MLRRLVCCVVGVVVAGLASQAPKSATRREFEVASIRADDGGAPLGSRISGSQVTIGLGLSALIKKAYRAQFTSSGQPVPGTFFVIRAKIPEGTTAFMVPEMLRSLLEDRFKLSAHWEQQVRKVYALRIDGAAKLTRAAGLDESLPGFDSGLSVSGPMSLVAPNGGIIRSSPTGDHGSKILSQGGSLDYVADILSRLMDRPVVDRTGLRGYFDFTLTFSAEDMERTMDPARVANLPPPTDPNASQTPSLRDSLKALGLRLEKADERVDVLVIDHIDAVPTEN